MFDHFEDFSVLPPNVVTHFEPTATFIKWLVDYADGRLIIEVGAGQCGLSKRLRDAGAKVLAIEPRPSEETLRECHNFLLPVSARRAAPLAKLPALVVVARPDHSGWFETLPLIMHPESELLYIGLLDNVERDIPDYFKIETLFIGAGEDGEFVLEVGE